MDSLNRVQYLLYLSCRVCLTRLICLVKSLNMKNNAFTGARIDKKTCKSESFAQNQLNCLLSQRSESNRFNR